MKQLFAMLFLFLCFTAFSLVPIPVKKLVGHWVSSTDISFFGPGDTVRFDKKKYSYELYALAKYPSGIEFREDATFAEYHNVGSDGSDNVYYHDEKYFFTGDSTIEIKGYARTFHFKIIKITSKKLAIKLLP